jgi:murein DD-endopeptidase MepM/ murein hydrolase activator NlpD
MWERSSPWQSPLHSQVQDRTGECQERSGGSTIRRGPPRRAAPRGRPVFAALAGPQVDHDARRTWTITAGPGHGFARSRRLCNGYNGARDFVMPLPCSIRLVLLLCLLGAQRTAADPRSGSADRFGTWLRADFPVADGFDSPVGDPESSPADADRSAGRVHDSWRVTTHFAERDSRGIDPGEDWSRTGSGDTDSGPEIRAVAHGRVAFAQDCGEPWRNVVMIDHLLYENHERRTIRSVYGHLGEIRVRAGQGVERGQVVGTIVPDPERTDSARLHLELRRDLSLAPTYWPSSNGRDEAWVREHYDDPRSFIAAHRHLFVPQDESALILVDTDARKMRLYVDKKAVGTFEVGFGQGLGRKRRQGDLCTPLGMYFVTTKSRGPFPGRWAAFYGGHWIKVNYPNAFDAAWGREHNLITADQARRIARAWAKREFTWEGSPLGGGLGFHGWINDWHLAGPRRLSWGCVVMRNADMAAVFSRIRAGTMAVVF